METITSRTNEFLKYVRKIRDGKIRDKFFVEGHRLTSELAKSRISVESVLVSSEMVSKYEEMISAFENDSADIKILDEGLFLSISQTKSPQGVAAVCAVPENGMGRIERAAAEDDKNILVLLHGVSNPGNLGSVIRTCEATGVTGVILTQDSAFPFLPAAVRGSMGSVFRVPVWFGSDFETVVEWAKENKFVTVRTDPGADRAYTELEWKRNIMFVFGSEAHGLDETARNSVEEAICIPMARDVESLNLAVAAGVVLYEAVKIR